MSLPAWQTISTLLAPRELILPIPDWSSSWKPPQEVNSPLLNLIKKERFSPFAPFPFWLLFSILLPSFVLVSSPGLFFLSPLFPVCCALLPSFSLLPCLFSVDCRILLHVSCCRYRSQSRPLGQPLLWAPDVVATERLVWGHYPRTMGACQCWGHFHFDLWPAKRPCAYHWGGKRFCDFPAQGSGVSRWANSF